MSDIQLTKPKQCGCGKVHQTIPQDHRLETDEGSYVGYYWDCECKSTLFVPLKHFTGATDAS